MVKICWGPNRFAGWNSSKNDRGQELRILLHSHAHSHLSEHTALLVLLSVEHNCSLKTEGELENKRKKRERKEEKKNDISPLPLKCLHIYQMNGEKDTPRVAPKPSQDKVTEDKNRSLGCSCVSTHLQRVRCTHKTPRHASAHLCAIQTYVRRHEANISLQIQLSRYETADQRQLKKKGEKILWKSLILQEPLRLNLNADT